MSYEYDLADFKRFLNDRNSAYRVDGLIFWQNRIPLPIDLFNRIFDEADLIITDYLYHIAAAATVISIGKDFKQAFSIELGDLPSEKLKNRISDLHSWINQHLSNNNKIVAICYEIADTLALPDFRFENGKIVQALVHQGKKYSRLYIPDQLRRDLDSIRDSRKIGVDNTDMFGNVIADRYDIYRSGFSDALAAIFNNLLEFRILVSGKSTHLKKFTLTIETPKDLDVRYARTKDGSLWEPGYGDDHFVTINIEHPLIRKIQPEQTTPLAEFLYFIGQFENSQFSDQNKKFLENMRQAISRNLWIKHDSQ